MVPDSKGILEARTGIVWDRIVKIIRIEALGVSYAHIPQASKDMVAAFALALDAWEVGFAAYLSRRQAGRIRRLLEIWGCCASRYREARYLY